MGKNSLPSRLGDNVSATGLDLQDMEQIAQAATEGLVAGTFDALLNSQSQNLGIEQLCPDCRRLCKVRFHDRPLVVQGGTINFHEPFCYCPACRRDFFPLMIFLRLDNHGYSPTILHRIVEAAVRLHSFADAAFALHLAGVPIRSRHVQP